MTAKTRATRAGFTLVEVLMVIAIIAILVSLLVVGLGKVRGQAKQVQARNDISQLDTVMVTFKKEFGFYPPSHVVGTRANGTTFVARFAVPTNVPNTLGSTDAALQNDASYNLLQRMFPRWQPAYNNANGQITDYDTATAGLAGKPLSPNQTLVFFLGGPNLNGFDVARPYNPTGGTKKGPFFEFPGGRLVPDPSNNLSQFVDPWGTPYAYFSAGGDNYDPRVSFPFTSDPAPAAYDPANDANAAGTFTVHPYRSSSKWLNPGKFQLISAGPDKLFGPGSQYSTNGSGQLVLGAEVWDAKNPQAGTSANYYGELSRGADDVANFNEGGALGAGS